MAEIFSGMETVLKNLSAVRDDMGAVIAACNNQREEITLASEANNRRQDQAQQHLDALNKSIEMIHDTMPKIPTAPNYESEVASNSEGINRAVHAAEMGYRR